MAVARMHAYTHALDVCFFTLRYSPGKANAADLTCFSELAPCRLTVATARAFPTLAKRFEESMSKPNRPTFQNAFNKRGELTLRQTGRAEELRRLREEDPPADESCDHRNSRGQLYLSPHCPRCGGQIRKLA